MIISIIVAHDEERVIGRAGGLPWHLPSDLARFKQLTLGKPVIMGRRTFESIGRPLPGRTNIVLTSRGMDVDGVEIAASLEEAFSLARATGASEAMVIGGGSVYAEALPSCHKLYLTEVHTKTGGDVWFPRLDPDEWHLVEEETVSSDDRNPHDLTHRVLVRSGFEDHAMDKHDEPSHVAPK